MNVEINLIVKKVCDFGLYSIVFQIMSHENSYFKLEITIFIRELSSYYCFNQKRIKIEFLDFFTIQRRVYNFAGPPPPPTPASDP